MPSNKQPTKDLVSQHALREHRDAKPSLGQTAAGMTLLLALNAAPALAGTVSVTTDVDALSDSCSNITMANVNASPVSDDGISLREAVCAANYTAGDDTINVPAGSYTLTLFGAGEFQNEAGDLNVFDGVANTGVLSIEGAGAAVTIIDGNNTDRLISTSTGLVVRNLTLQNGNVGAEGGAVRVVGPGKQVTLESSILQNNSATVGGALYATGSGNQVTLESSVVRNNSASLEGGGIYVDGVGLTVTNSLISTNTAVQDGGGMLVQNNAGIPKVLRIADTTVDNNNASNGGGILVLSSFTETRIINSTISGNGAASGYGGGLVSRETLIVNSTVVNNTAAGDAGGIRLDGFSLATHTIQNSLIAGNSASGVANEIQRIDGALTVDGNNLFGHAGETVAQAYAGFTPGATDIDATSDAAPSQALASMFDQVLADNGGPTPTHALVPSSLALDAGDNAKAVDETGTPLATDQRGFDRIANTTVDIGAYEKPVLTVELIWRSTTGSGTPGSDKIEAVAGDVLELDVLVTDGGTCDGLVRASLSLYWNDARVTGYGAQECPGPENFLYGAGICHDSAGNAFVPVNGVSESAGAAEGFDTFYFTTNPGYECGEAMYLGRTTFVVDTQGITEVDVGYRPGVDLIVDGLNNPAMPEATATIKPPGC